MATAIELAESYELADGTRLYVSICHVSAGFTSHGQPVANLPKAWRVSVIDPTGDIASFPMAFARKVDACMAMQSLLDAGLDTDAKIIERRSETDRIMCENLQW